MEQGEVRDRLVEEARAELVERGPGKVSLRAIARRVGVSHQAVAHHFADRSGLFTQVAVEGLAELAARCDRVLAQGAGSTPVETVADLGTSYVEYADENPAVFELMFGSGAGLVDPRDARILEARAAVWTRLLGAFQAAAAEGWGGGTDPAVLAVTAWSTVHGLATLRREGVTLGTMDYDTRELFLAALGTVRFGDESSA